VEFREVLEGRHSVREFSGTPIPKAAVDRVVAAAGLAPSLWNLQPWHFHIAADDARVRIGEIIARTTVHLAEYMEVLGPEGYQQAEKWYSELGGAPVVIGVSMVPSEDQLETTNMLLSVGAAVENLLLAAVDEGLGACNVTFTQWVREELEEAFGIGAGRVMTSVVVLGHPSETVVMRPPRNIDIADWVE
jgi:nitroreductase